MRKGGKWDFSDSGAFAIGSLFLTLVVPTGLMAKRDVPYAGYDLHNTANAAKETIINRDNIDEIMSEPQIEWVYRTSTAGDDLLGAMLDPSASVGDVASPLTMKGNMLYVSDQSGKVHAIYAKKLSGLTTSVDTYLQPFNAGPPFYGYNPFNPPSYNFPKGGLMSNVPTPQVKWIKSLPSYSRANPSAPDQIVLEPNLNANFAISQKYRGIFAQRASVTVGDSNTLLIGNNGSGRNFIDTQGNANPAYLFPNGPTGAVLVAINRTDGSFKWSTVIDDQPTAIITSSPVAYKGVAYVGVSTYESGLSGMFADPNIHDKVPLIFGPDYTECCTFRGSVVAVDINSGKILWKRLTITPQDNVKAIAELDWRQRPTTIQDGRSPVSHSGSSVWGSTPVVDKVRSSIYVGTGQNHTIPEGAPGDFVSGVVDTAYCEVERQLILAGDLAVDAAHLARAHDTLACVGDKNYMVTVLSLNKGTGAVKWATKLQGFDVWNSSCLSNLTNFTLFGLPQPPVNLSMCPISTGAIIDRVLKRDALYPFGPHGPMLSHDHDIGQGPMLIKNVAGVRTMVDPRNQAMGYLPGTRTMDLLLVGSKKGYVYAMNPDNGQLVWTRRVDDVELVYKGQVINYAGFILGGLEFGSATDGKHIFTASANSLQALLPVVFDALPDVNDLDCASSIVTSFDGRDPTLDRNCPIFQLGSAIANNFARIKKFNGTTAEVRSGWWSALNVKDGTIVWQTAAEEGIGQQQVLEGMVSVANGVMFGGTNTATSACLFSQLRFIPPLNNCAIAGAEGYFFALDANTGEILKTFNTRRGAVYARPTVSSGSVYWPTGQSRFTSLFLPGNLIYAFNAKGLNLVEDEDLDLVPDDNDDGHNGHDD